MTAPPLLFDRALHRRRLERAAPRFSDAGFLKARAAADLADRLGGILREFPRAVDLCARDGAMVRALAESGAGARVGWLVEADLSERMLAGRAGPRLVLDEERLPFAAQSLDLVVSALGLHWANDLPGVMVQIRRALKPNGLFLGSILGGATLHELRACLMQAEIELMGGAGPRVSPFAEAHDAAGLLQRAGFALPVADSDKVVVRYQSPLRLLSDLRAMGETSVLADRPEKSLTRAVLGRALALYEERYRDAEGRLAATFEILTLTGWAPHASQPKPLRPGSAQTRLADVLGTRERKL